MKRIKYNDYELLYLISEHSSRALEIMYEKYRPLILARIKEMNISYNNHDDYYQEGLITLHVCINRFSDLYNKTFTRYFDFCLRRKFIDLSRVNNKYCYNTVFVENDEMLCEETFSYGSDYIDYSKYFKKLSKFEEKVFKLKYLDLCSINEIAEITGSDIKKIYNALSRLKIKLNEEKKTIDKWT